MNTRLRRSHPEELEEVPPGCAPELAELLAGIHACCDVGRTSSPATQLVLPGGMQPPGVQTNGG